MNNLKETKGKGSEKEEGKNEIWVLVINHKMTPSHVEQVSPLLQAAQKETI